MASAVLVGFASYLLLPLAQLGAVAAAGLVVPLLGLASFVVGVCLPIYFVNTITVRQATVADHLQGRVVGTIRTVVIACTPVGALVGGALGQYLGLVPTLLIGAAVGALALGWIAAGPIRLTSVRRSEVASARRLISPYRPGGALRTVPRWQRPARLPDWRYGVTDRVP